MEPKEVLSRQLESLLTTSGVLEIALERNPKLIEIIEQVVGDVKLTMAGEDGRRMSILIDHTQSPLRFLADKITADRKRRERQAEEAGQIFEGDKDA